MKIFNQIIFCFILLFCVASLSGCFRQRGPVLVPTTGVLTRGGKPLAEVRIEFQHVVTGAFSFSETDEQGRFSLIHTHGKNGVEPGKYRVAIFRPGKPVPIPPGRPIPPELPMTPDEPIRMSDNSPIEIEIASEGMSELRIDLK